MQVRAVPKGLSEIQIQRGQRVTKLKKTSKHNLQCVSSSLQPNRPLMNQAFLLFIWFPPPIMCFHYLNFSLFLYRPVHLRYSLRSLNKYFKTRLSALPTSSYCSLCYLIHHSEWKLPIQGSVLLTFLKVTLIHCSQSLTQCLIQNRHLINIC